jgi:hypothetical protein
MAVDKGTFGLIVALTILTIAASCVVLAYAGGINQRGSDEQKRFLPQVRKWLIGIFSVLLALSVTTLIVSAVQYSQPAPLMF